MDLGFRLLLKDNKMLWCVVGEAYFTWRMQQLQVGLRTWVVSMWETKVPFASQRMCRVGAGGVHGQVSM